MAADRVVTLTAAMKDRLGGDGVDPATIDLVPNAVDPDLFPLVERNNALAESLGIRRDETTVGYISSLVGYEGVDVLIDACAQLLEMGHRVRCVVVGDGDDRARLEKHAADRGVASEVVFTGRVDRSLIADHYGLIDIFVVPRLPLPVTEIVTPHKPYEALSTGRVLVMSDVGALRPIAEASAAAELFEAGDPAALADVLARLILDPERRRRLAADGAAWVRAKRTWQANGDRYRKLYADMGVL